MRFKIVNGNYVKVSEFDADFVPVDSAGQIVETRLRHFAPEEIMQEEMRAKSERNALRSQKMALLIQRQREEQEERLANLQRNANYLRAVAQQNACFDRKQAQRAYLSSPLMRPYTMPYEESAYLLAKNTEFSVDVFEDHSDYANAKAVNAARLDVPLAELATEAEFATSLGVKAKAPQLKNTFSAWGGKQTVAPITLKDVIEALKLFFKAK